MCLSNTEDKEQDCHNQEEPSPETAEEDHDSESSPSAPVQSFPLPPRWRAMSIVLLVHCRTVLKEIIGCTYLIKDTQSLQELADELEKLYSKVRNLTPQKMESQ